MDTNRGRVLFVMVDSAGKYGDMYRQLFPDLRNATFFVSQPGEPQDCTHSLAVCKVNCKEDPRVDVRQIPALTFNSSARGKTSLICCAVNVSEVQHCLALRLL